MTDTDENPDVPTPEGYWTCPNCQSGMDVKPDDICPACKAPVAAPEPPEPTHHKKSKH